MTLFRQLVIALTVLFTCLLAGNLFVSVYNARSYFYEQMQAHAEDTATFLGFTISRAAQQKDVAMLNSMIDVIFDRGYYRRIAYLDLKGEAVVERERPIQIENVPSWFVSSVELPAPLGRAEVVSGWLQVGELVVEGHPGYAYRDLWRVLKEQLWLFAVSVGLSCALAGLGLRYLLRPLRKLETQAAAICRRTSPQPGIAACGGGYEPDGAEHAGYVSGTGYADRVPAPPGLPGPGNGAIQPPRFRRPL
ncbi:MAG: LapD/MoxY N-terminal periplasmic domain-containing protein [Exilibacterium sp.]